MKLADIQLSILKIILKIARLDGCSCNELPARLNEQRYYGHAAVSTENGQKGKTIKLNFQSNFQKNFLALVCFGSFGDTGKTCEIFDGS